MLELQESLVEFHKGKLVYGILEGKKVIIMQGRFHIYEGYSLQDVTYPVRIMKHDVIGFNYSLSNEIHGEIYISIDRVQDNAEEFSQAFETELLRVMAHGVLHFCGYNDKTGLESSLMRSKEDFYLNQLNDMPS